MAKTDNFDSPLKAEAREVWAVAWPLILTNLLNVAVHVVDYRMVGQLGVAPIAAVGAARQVMMLLMVLTIAISGGSSVLVAHAFGAGDQQRVREVAGRSLLIMVLTSLLIVVPLGLLVSRALLVALGAKPEVVALGTPYLHVLFLGSVFPMFNIGVTRVLLGVGKTRISLMLLILVNVLNVTFNYLLIFGIGPLPALGVTGAALGTVLAHAVGSAAAAWIVHTPRGPVNVRYKDMCRLDLTLLRKIMYLGGPRSLQGVVRNVSRLITIRVITLLPEATRVLGAYTVGMQVRMTSTFVGLAFMSAAMSRVGQNLGAKRPERAVRSGWISAAMAAVLMGLVALMMLLFPERIMSWFVKDREVIAMGRVFFMVIALAEPIMAFALAIGGALRGAGDPVSPFLFASISDLVVVISMGYLLAVYFGMGLTGIAIAIALSAVTRAVPTMLRFRQGKWASGRHR